MRWVELNKVINYLEHKGIEIDTMNLNETIYYTINSKRYFAPQIVLKANQLRLEEKKPIFLVQGITW